MLKFETLVFNPLTKLEELKHLICEMMRSLKNMRPNPELPLVTETDASESAVGASLVQEITTEGCSKEKALIYAVSRSFKSAETRYSTIRRELLAVVFLLCRS